MNKIELKDIIISLTQDDIQKKGLEKHIPKCANLKLKFFRNSLNEIPNISPVL